MLLVGGGGFERCVDACGKRVGEPEKQPVGLAFCRPRRGCDSDVKGVLFRALVSHDHIVVEWSATTLYDIEVEVKQGWWRNASRVVRLGSQR